MSVCVCIASRGRPQQLNHSVKETLRLAGRSDTQVVVALDDDDPTLGEYEFGISAPRENSLGAKFNRAASYARSDTTLFVLANDDSYMSSENWDEILLYAASKFPDGVGCVYFGIKDVMEPQLPDSMAVTKGWIDEVGFFCPPYFPYWWHDTWIDELARMTKRYIWARVSWEKHGQTEVDGHKTTRMREIIWWSNFFDITRAGRMQKAWSMLAKLEYPEWVRFQAQQDIMCMAQSLYDRGYVLRDHHQVIEQNYGVETEPDPGYDEIKAQAEAMITEILADSQRLESSAA